MEDTVSWWWYNKAKYIEKFKLYIKKYYCTVWGVEKIQKEKVLRPKNGRTMLLPKCEVRNSKKSKFIKGKEASRLSIILGIKTPLSKIPFLGPLLLLEY